MAKAKRKRGPAKVRLNRVNSSQTFCIKFFAPIVSESISLLMKVVDQKVHQGARKLVLLISTPGGDVFQGLSAYSYLKGVPLEVETHNFGSADSIGVVLFCAGSRRYSVPHARFLIHSVMWNVRKPMSLIEQQLEEYLKSLRIDTANIAQVIADTTDKSQEDIIKDMQERITLNANQAIDYGLVHEIKSGLFDPGIEVTSIEAQPRPINEQEQKQTKEIVLKN